MVFILTIRIRTGLCSSLAASSEGARLETSHHRIQGNVAQEQSTYRNAICAFTSSSHALVPQRFRQSHSRASGAGQPVVVGLLWDPRALPRSHLRICLQPSRRRNTVLPRCHADDDPQCCATLKNGLPTSESLGSSRHARSTGTASAPSRADCPATIQQE